MEMISWRGTCLEEEQGGEEGGVEEGEEEAVAEFQRPNFGD